MVGQHGDQRAAGIARHHAQGRGIARLVGFGVQRHFQHVGRGRGIGRDIPAGVEIARGRDIGTILALDPDLVTAPGHLCLHLHRRVRQHRLAIGDAGAGGGRLPVPAAVHLIPLVMRLQPVDGPFDLHRHRFQRRIQRDELEPGTAVFRHLAIVEHRLDADHRRGRRHRRGDLPLDRPPRAFGDADIDPRLQRARHRIVELREGDRHFGLAVLVGAGARIERVVARRNRLVVAAEHIARPGVEAVLGRQPHLTLDGQIRPRRTEQVAGVDGQGRRLVERQHALGQAEVEVDAFGQEILDQHPFAGQRRRVRIAQQIQPPGAARRGGRGRQVEHIAAGILALGQHPGIFHPVRAIEHRRHRQALQRLDLRIARQRGDVDGLAGTVDPAIGGHEHVDRPAGILALDAPVGQVELGVCQRQERQVVTRFGGQQRRLRPAAAPGQPGIEADIAAVVGGGGAQHRVRPRHQRHLHPGPGIGRGQRADEDVQPLASRHRGQPQIRDHEPLRRRRAVIGIDAGHRGLQHVDSGLQPLDHLAQRQPGGDVLVQLGVQRALAGPDILGDLVTEILVLVIVQRLAEIVVLDRADQVAVRHPAQLQVDLGHIDADDRQRHLAGGGQDIAAAGKAHLGRTVADIEGQHRRLHQHLARGRLQPGPERDMVGLAMFQPLDADLAAVRGHHRIALIQRHVAGIVRPAGQHRLGKRGADPRAGQIAFHRIVGDAKAVFRPRRIQRLQDIVARSDGLRQFEHRDHRLAAARRLQRLGQLQQRIHPPGRLHGPQIARQRRVARRLGEIVLLALVAAGPGQHQPGVFHPQIRVVRQRQRRSDIENRVLDVALAARLVRGGLELRHAPAAGVELLGDVEREVARPGQRVFAKKADLGTAGAAVGDHGRIGDQYPRRSRAVELLAVPSLALEEAGVRFLVVRQCLARFLRQTGRLAGIVVRIEDRLDVTAGEIGIVLDRQPLGRHHIVGAHAGGEGKRNCEGKQKRRDAHAELRI